MRGESIYSLVVVVVGFVIAFGVFVWGGVSVFFVGWCGAVVFFLCTSTCLLRFELLSQRL